MHNGDGIISGIFKQSLQGNPETLRIGIADNIDRIGARPCGRHVLIETITNGWRELGHLATKIKKIVDGDHT